MLLLCKHIYIFYAETEELKTIEQEYVMYKGPLIKLCYTASFRNNVVEHYPWSWDPEILFWAVCPNCSIKSHDCVVEGYTCVNILKYCILLQI